jgi:hypothetical protein
MPHMVPLPNGGTRKVAEVDECIVCFTWIPLGRNYCDEHEAAVVDGVKAGRCPFCQHKIAPGVPLFCGCGMPLLIRNPLAHDVATTPAIKSSRFRRWLSGLFS